MYAPLTCPFHHTPTADAKCAIDYELTLQTMRLIVTDSSNFYGIQCNF